MKIQINPRTVQLCAVAGLLFLLAGCGPQVIKGEAPFVSISTLSTAGENVSADFDIRNINGLEMNIDGIEISVTINDVELTRYNDRFELTIAANGTEEVHVDALPDDFRADLLTSLAAGDVVSLPFSIEGRVHTVEDGFLDFEQEGHLYPIPGRPGQFRSATTRSDRR